MTTTKDETLTDPRLLWVDIESTGLVGPGPGNLDDGGLLLEVGLILTDADLDIIDTTSRVIAYPPSVLAGVRSLVVPAVEEMHASSGLWDDVAAAQYPIGTVERHLLQWLRDGHLIAPGTLPMCGNSVGTDRRWLAERMPALEAFFHYRQIDVSSFKEVVRRWYPPEKRFAIPPSKAHRALGDLRDSIAELRHYREHVFQTATIPAGA